MRLRLAALALTLAGGAGAAAQTPVELADGRTEDPRADVTGWEARPPIR